MSERKRKSREQLEAELPPEHPAVREARLKRRRRLLGWGALPAVLLAVVALWMGTVSGLTLAANRAAVKGDYGRAVARYETVRSIDPWLEEWRVHYNLGTAQMLAQDLDSAIASLSTALTEAPKAKQVQGSDGATGLDPEAPECLVRINLYVAHTAKAEDAKDSATRSSETAAAKKAAGDCEIPKASQPTSNPSATATSTATSTATPTAQPSASSSPQPSGSASPSQGGTASATPSSGSSSQPTAGQTASATASPSISEQEKRLQDRNNRANPTATTGVSGNGSGTKQW